MKSVYLIFGCSCRKLFPYTKLTTNLGCEIGLSPVLRLERSKAGLQLYQGKKCKGNGMILMNWTMSCALLEVKRIVTYQWKFLSYFTQVCFCGIHCKFKSTESHSFRHYAPNFLNSLTLQKKQSFSKHLLISIFNPSVPT